MTIRDEAPAEISLFLDQLEKRGFRWTANERIDEFNQMVVLTNGVWEIDVIADRGEWSLGVRPRGYSLWLHPDVLEAYLEGFDLAGDFSPISHQTKFLLDVLTSEVAGQLRVAGVQGALRSLGEDYMRRGLGLGPPESGPSGPETTDPAHE